jgi:integrase
MQTKNIPYTFNRGGYYYFTRRVPSDLIGHYSYPRVVQGLRTSSPSQAKTRALIAAAKLDEYWCRLRMTDPDLLGSHLLKDPRTANHINSDSISLSHAIDLYVQHKGQGKGKTFHASIQRAFRYLVKACGSKDLHEYTRADALKYRDHLVKKGLAGSSITRVLNTVRPVFNFSISEYALDIKNPFVGIYHDRSYGVSKRLPIPVDLIRKIQKECVAYDDEMRWIVAILSDTGMRLGEAAGLLKSDLKIDGEIPYIIIQPHAWRRLKTESSNRKIPLVGQSLWAARQLLKYANSSEFAFPRYNRQKYTNANSASAALNKWLKGYVSKGQSIHSLRHSIRDRLREVDCPSEVIDQIGGWARSSVGDSYGEGYSLSKMNKYLKEITQVISTPCKP